ncbi:MAG: hypothetical protein ACO1N7_07715, partial [Sphingobacteriaceae bacterium]
MADLSFVNTREFSRLISKPSTLTVFDMTMLEDLVELYPFSYPLHISYAYALNKFKPDRFDDYIAKAAIYTPDRKLLYKVLNDIDGFENSDIVEQEAVSHEALQEFLEKNDGVADIQESGEIDETDTLIVNEEDITENETALPDANLEEEYKPAEENIQEFTEFAD